MLAPMASTWASQPRDSRRSAATLEATAGPQRQRLDMPRSLLQVAHAHRRVDEGSEGLRRGRKRFRADLLVSLPRLAGRGFYK